MPQLNATGLGMVLIAVLAFFIPQPNLRNVAVCAGVGLLMWARAFVALRSLGGSQAAAPTVRCGGSDCRT